MAKVRSPLERNTKLAVANPIRNPQVQVRLKWVSSKIIDPPSTKHHNAWFEIFQLVDLSEDKGEELLCSWSS